LPPGVHIAFNIDIEEAGRAPSDIAPPFCDFTAAR
jgi:hypothetical protein